MQSFIAKIYEISLFGATVNFLLVIIGALIGMAFKRGLSDKMADTLMKGLGLCTLFLGISGSLVGENSMILILSMVIGALIGEGIDLEDKLNRFGEWIESRFGKKKVPTDSKLVESAEGIGKKETSLAEGFVTASLLFGVGAMAIVGSLQSGMSGNHEILISKSILDFVAAIIFSSTMGVGVALAGGLVFVYEGSLTLLAEVIAPYLSDSVINEMSCVGSVIIIGLALNMLGVTKLKVMNYVPAVFVPILLCMFM